MHTPKTLQQQTMTALLVILAFLRLQGKGWLIVDLCIIALLVAEILL